MQGINQLLGQILRQLRQERGWSLDKAAMECGVSKAMLGQIERGASSPTVATLWKIATGFRVSLSHFFERQVVSNDPVLFNPSYRGPQPGQQQTLADGVVITPLMPYEPYLGYEFFLVETPPGCTTYSEPHCTGSIELVLPLCGTMELWLNGEWQPLLPGEIIRFAGDQPHGYRNLGDEPMRFHNLIHYSSAAAVMAGSL